jgi:hypothetical protein
VEGFNERPAAIAVDPHSGTVYVTGSSSSGGPFTRPEYATVAYDALGNQLWVARYDGRYDGSAHAATAFAIAVDPNSGTVYVTGTSNGDYATVAYDASGDQLWVARYDGPGHSNDSAWAIAVDPNSGAVYVTGDSYPGGYATVAYDAGGNQLWVARYEGPGGTDKVSAIALDLTSGNVYVTGYSYGGAATGYDYATVAYDACGNQLWVARYDDPSNGGDSARAIALDPASGNVYVTGGSQRGATNLDYATVAYDACGNQLWVARYEGPGGYDKANAIALDPTSGNLYVTGLSYGGLATRYDYATVAYDASGRQLWVARHNGPSDYNDEANAVAVAPGSGDVYVTGYDYGRDGGGTTSYATVAYSTSEMADSPEISPMGGPQEVRRPRCHACCSNGSTSSDETTSGSARAIRWCGRMYKRLLKIESRKGVQHQVDLDEFLTAEVEQHQP